MATRVPFADRDTEKPAVTFPASPSMSTPTCVQEPPLSSYILTWPAELPFPSLEGAPMATRVPSADRDTEKPDKSLAASPSMSAPTCVQESPLSSYILTWPAVPTLEGAPMAMRVPSADRDTEEPDTSFAASPLMSAPTCVQEPPLSSYILTWPVELPFPSLAGAPMAMRVPSADRDTERPEMSPATSPSISAPICVQEPPLSSYILTWPAKLPFPSLKDAPMATRVPSKDRDTDSPDRSPAASPSMSRPTCVCGQPSMRFGSSLIHAQFVASKLSVVNSQPSSQVGAVLSQIPSIITSVVKSQPSSQSVPHETISSELLHPGALFSIIKVLAPPFVIKSAISQQIERLGLLLIRTALSTVVTFVRPLIFVSIILLLIFSSPA